MVHGEERGVRRVPAGGDAQHRGPRRQPGRVQQPPLVIHPRLDHGVEVHRGEPGRVHRDQPGRHVAGPQQRQHQVRVVPAHPLAQQQGVHRVVAGPAGPAEVQQPLVHPAGDRPGQLGRVLDLAELGRRGGQEAVRRAVPAGPAVAEQVVLGGLRGGQPPVDVGRVVDDQATAVGVQHVHPAAVRRGHLAGFDRRAVQGGDQLLVGGRGGHRDLQRQQGGFGDVELEMGGDLTAHALIVSGQDDGPMSSPRAIPGAPGSAPRPRRAAPGRCGRSGWPAARRCAPGGRPSSSTPASGGPPRPRSGTAR